MYAGHFSTADASIKYAATPRPPPMLKVSARTKLKYPVSNGFFYHDKSVYTRDHHEKKERWSASFQFSGSTAPSGDYLYNYKIDNPVSVLV